MPSILDDVDNRLERKKKPKYIKSMTMTVISCSETILTVKIPNWIKEGEFNIFASNIPAHLRQFIREGAKFTFTGNSRMLWWGDFVETIRHWKYVPPKAGKNKTTEQ